MQRLPAAQGMVSAALWLCVRLLMCVMAARLFQKEVRFKRKSPKKDQFSLKSILVVSRQFDSLKSVLSLKHFLLNRSRYCILKLLNSIQNNREQRKNMKTTIERRRTEQLLICFFAG